MGDISKVHLSSPFGLILDKSPKEAVAEPRLAAFACRQKHTEKKKDKKNSRLTSSMMTKAAEAFSFVLRGKASAGGGGGGGGSPESGEASSQSCRGCQRWPGPSRPRSRTFLPHTHTHTVSRSRKAFTYTTLY